MCKCFDIRKDVSVENERFYWVDTQVLLWSFYYPTVSFDSPLSAQQYQLNYYPAFISKLIASECTIATTVYNISELINCIIRSEYDFYLTSNGINKKSLTFKSFRNNNRDCIKSSLKFVLTQLQNIIFIEDAKFSMDDVNQFVDSYETQTLDFFDNVLLMKMVNDECKYLITDDVDFSICNYDVVLFTANNRIITA